ncbi:MAG: hypothetical protein ABSG67_01000 [Thermoguttaceae bacterium]
MNIKDKAKKRPTEKDIDRLVVSQVDDDSAWEKSVHVRRNKPASLSIPADLAARAAFLARLHRKNNMADWLRHIIEERVELEEAVFVGLKHDLNTKTD